MFSIGVDLGGTNIAAAIVSDSGEIIKKGSTPTLSDRNYEAIVADMCQLCKRLIDEAGMKVSDIHSVGIGSPGIPDPDNGVIVYANNLHFKDTPIREEFQKHLNLPVYVENDANVAALGEYESGAGKLYSDFVAVTLGTGVGGGVILNRKIIGGSFHAGAELGHIVIKAGGVQCTCGRKGCWETYSSATGLIREAKHAADDNPESMLYKMVEGNLDKMNAKIPFDAAQGGDAIAQGVIDQYVADLASGLVNLINIFQPEIIVLGGGVSAQKDNLLVPLREMMSKEIYGGPSMFKTKIEVAQLGNDAGIIGAAMLYKLTEEV